MSVVVVAEVVALVLMAMVELECFVAGNVVVAIVVLVATVGKIAPEMRLVVWNVVAVIACCSELHAWAVVVVPVVDYRHLVWESVVIEVR